MNDIENVLDTAYCKCKYSTIDKGHEKLHRWKNWEANTPFAPVFDVPIWLDDIREDVVSDLVNAIEENNLGMYRQLWEDYNIFKWEYPALTSLRATIARIYKEYMEALHLDAESLDSLWIRGWAVVLEPGEEVTQHCHAYHENTYLSGNISLSDTGTVTNYLIPHLSSYYGPWMAQNKPGRLTMFPSWVEHYVEPVATKRYSIGFDLFDFNSIKYISDNREPNNKSQETILQSIPLA